MPVLWAFIALAGATFVSEDLACVAAGQLVRLDQLDWHVAAAACFAGIYLGDLGLWIAGRALGRRMLRWSWISRRIPPERMKRLADWFDHNGGVAILCSRFVPGPRLPMYVGAGALGRRGWAFAGWTLVAALLWTPLIVLLVAGLGDAFAKPFTRIFGSGWALVTFGAMSIFLLLWIPRLFLDEQRRARFIACVSKAWRWEFWPTWLFYLPLVPWIAWLVARHRSLTVITAVNPGIPHGGVVGESKAAILARIAGPHVLPGRLVSCIADLSPEEFPLVLKPDAGQRGAGVRFCATMEDAAEYLRSATTPILAQVAHPGPHEAGIFYYRIPGEVHGQIFSITDKQFPLLIGDGVHTIAQLVWRHPRFRMQAGTFFVRHASALDRVLAPGETFQLARAGNHCQGTLFRDGEHLRTPQLEQRIDEIAQRFGDGFCFGRFDVRYADAEAFKSGQDLAVVELNGLTSESTNLYDPSWSLPRAYATLFRQWSLLFRIAAENRRRGVRVSTLREVLAEVRRFYARAASNPISD